MLPRSQPSTRVLRGRLFLSAWKGVLSLILVAILCSAAAADEGELFTGCAVDDYYSSILIDNSIGSVSRASLEELVQTTHRRVLKYTDNDGDDVWKALMDLDAGVQDSDTSAPTVHLIYRDLDILSSLFNVPDGGWNREHLWPKSRGVGDGGADYTDIHHLRPSDWGVNAARGNKYFSECISGCKVPATEEAADDTASGSETWLPPESARGVVARALLYMELRYADFVLNDCPSNDNDFDMAYLSQLLQWHAMYPPTQQEELRNDKACSRWQGNRNPFVDFPELVPTFFGEPQQESPPYTCAPPVSTEVPSVSSCSANGLDSGSMMVTQVNSANPDLVALVVLTNITAGGGTSLYMTDNAWTGDAQGFRSNEGTLRRSFGTDIVAGTILTFPGAGWESVQGSFSLSASGDTILLYCQTETELVHISGLSFAGDWLPSGLDPSAYGTGNSALPVNTPAVTLDHADNYRYTGTRTGSMSSLQSSISSSSNWESSNGGGFALDDTPFKLSSVGTSRSLNSVIGVVSLLFGVIVAI
jgi:hypothetical protein